MLLQKYLGNFVLLYVNASCILNVVEKYLHWNLLWQQNIKWNVFMQILSWQNIFQQNFRRQNVFQWNPLWFNFVQFRSFNIIFPTILINVSRLNDFWSNDFRPNVFDQMFFDQILFDETATNHFFMPTKNQETEIAQWVDEWRRMIFFHKKSYLIFKDAT